LIFGHFGFPELGVLGSGIASTIAMAFGSLFYSVLAWRLARSKGFGRVKPSGSTIKKLLKFSIPYGVQQVLFAAAFTIFYWIVGHMGTEEVAASAVLVNLTLFAFLPGIAYGIAAATFVGQSVAKNDWREARHWAADVMKLGLLSLTLLAVPFSLFPTQVLALFIQEPHVVELAVTPLRIAGVFLFAEAIGMVLMQTLHAVGEAKNVMRISVGVQWLYFLPLSYVAGPVLGGGLVAVWAVHASYRVLQALLFWLRWRAKVQQFIA
jgi:putative MATE family efflux protein